MRANNPILLLIYHFKPPHLCQAVGQPQKSLHGGGSALQSVSPCIKSPLVYHKSRLIVPAAVGQGALSLHSHCIQALTVSMLLSSRFQQVSHQVHCCTCFLFYTTSCRIRAGPAPAHQHSPAAAGLNAPGVLPSASSTQPCSPHSVRTEGRQPQIRAFTAFQQAGSRCRAAVSWRGAGGGQTAWQHVLRLASYEDITCV